MTISPPSSAFFCCRGVKALAKSGIKTEAQLFGLYLKRVGSARNKDELKITTNELVEELKEKGVRPQRNILLNSVRQL